MSSRSFYRDWLSNRHSEMKSDLLTTIYSRGPKRSIDLWRETVSGGKKIHIQILDGIVPTRECEDSQAVIVFRDENGLCLDQLREAETLYPKELGHDVELEYAAAKAKGGKFATKGVILTKAGTNPGRNHQYLLHLPMSVNPLKFMYVLKLAFNLQLAEKHEMRSVAFPPYLLLQINIDSFIELIEDFAKEYRPICLDFVQLFVSETDFEMCIEMRQKGGLERIHRS